MPELFRIDGYGIYFGALDGEHGVHVHVRHGGRRDLAKMILGADGSVVVAHNKGHLPRRDLERIRSIVEMNAARVVEDWSRMFPGAIHFDR